MNLYNIIVYIFGIIIIILVCQAIYLGPARSTPGSWSLTSSMKVSQYRETLLWQFLQRVYILIL